MAVVLALLLAAPARAETPSEIWDAYHKGFCNRAFEYWAPRAEQGDPDAQLGLSDYYSDGDCVAEDDAKALMWLRKSAEQGYAEAQDSLGTAYYMGDLGLPDDLVKAFVWTSRALENGYTGMTMRDDILAEMEDWEVDEACDLVKCPPDIEEEHARLAAKAKQEKDEEDAQSATIEVCNKSYGGSAYIAYATGAGTDGSGNALWHVQGWRVISEDQCSTLWTGPLTNRYYYIYAQDSEGHWGGDYYFCVQTEAFDWTGVQHTDCGDKRGFSQVDMSINDRVHTGYTLNLTP